MQQQHHAPTQRAVVFALEDLPEADSAHILLLARHLHLEIAPDSLRTPFVLTREDVGPVVPGLRSDAELVERSDGLALLSLRLLLCDAHDWPEQGFLGTEGAAFTIYATEPGRWSRAALARELGERMEVREGLRPRAARPPGPRGARVPVLGWQVPLLGAKDPLHELRDVRPADQRRYHCGGMTLPLGMVPGNNTDRYRLFLRVLDARREGDRGRATVETVRVDGALGEAQRTVLDLRLQELGHALPHLGAEHESADDGDLRELLQELLAGCLLCTGRGELLLLDLYRLGLAVETPEPSLRLVPAPELPAGPDGDGPELLDPSVWEATQLAALLHPEETRVSRRGRFVALHFAGQRDGLPIDAFVLLDTEAARVLVWPAELDGPPATLAISDDEERLAYAGPALATDPSGAEEKALRLFELPSLGLLGTVELPAPPSLWFLPGTHTLVAHQPAGRAFLTVEESDAAAAEGRVRPTRRADLSALLLAERGQPLRRLLRSLLAARVPPQDADEVPALAFLDPPCVAGLDAATLLRLPPEQAAAAVLDACEALRDL